MAIPTVAAIQDIEDGKVETAEIVKAWQTALLFLGNASQHHAVQCRHAILQQLNPQLKSLNKDEEFADAPPYLFGECFASLAKECLEAALVLKKSVSTSSTVKQGYQRGHPQRYAWGHGGSSQYQTTNKSKQHFQIGSSSSKEMTRTIPCTTLFTCVKPIIVCSHSPEPSFSLNE